MEHVCNSGSLFVPTPRNGETTALDHSPTIPCPIERSHRNAEIFASASRKLHKYARTAHTPPENLDLSVPQDLAGYDIPPLLSALKALSLQFSGVSIPAYVVSILSTPATKSTFK